MEDYYVIPLESNANIVYAAVYILQLIFTLIRTTTIFFSSHPSLIPVDIVSLIWSSETSLPSKSGRLFNEKCVSRFTLHRLVLRPQSPFCLVKHFEGRRGVM